MRNTGILQHLRFNTTPNCVTHHSSGGFRMARRCARSDLTLLGESACPKQACTSSWARLLIPILSSPGVWLTPNTLS